MKEQISALQGPVMVLGAGGFVGANLARMLRAERDDVVVVAHTTASWRLEGLSDVRAVDVTDARAVRTLVEDIRPRTVFDCTAYGGYPFQGETDRIYAVNFDGVRNVVEALADVGFTAYVHAGTSSEYGKHSAGPSEDSALSPNSHYAASKAAAAEYLHFCGRTRQLPVVNLRLYSVYGPMEESTRLVPTVLDSALNNTTVRLSSPDPVRDFVYITDVCRAFVLAALGMGPELAGQSLNIGTGTETSIATLVGLVQADHPGLTAAYGAPTDRPWEVQHWFALPDRARLDIGWVPQIDLQEGLRLTARWRAENPSPTPVLPTDRASLPSVSAVIACYNEGPAVAVMHQRLTETFVSIGCDYEIIFVNNGSTDGTDDVLRSLSEHDPHLIGINHSRSFGSQMAFYSGMEVSTKDAVAILDGDLQDPPELIADMYEKLREGYDVVYGRRVKREMSRWAEAPYRAFYALFRAISEIDIPRDAGDFSLMSRRAVNWLLESPERDLFIRGLRAYVGFRQTGIDYVRPDRMFGKSSNNIRKNIGWAKKAIFAYSRKPLDLLTNAGFLLLAVSVVAILLQVVLRIAFPASAPRGFSSLFLLVVFFGSATMLGIGILGEYLGKVLEEVKARPRYIRASIVRNGKEEPQSAPGGKVVA